MANFAGIALESADNNSASNGYECAYGKNNYRTQSNRATSQETRDQILVGNDKNDVINASSS